MDRVSALELISPIAAEQAGLVTSRQATRVGVAHGTLVALGNQPALRRLRRGVYVLAFGRATHPQEDLLAAWLALDGGVLPWERTNEPRAIISHASAASIHGLGTIIPRLPELTTQRRAGHHSGIRLHTAPFVVDDWCWQAVADTRFPVTTVGRTIVDLVLDHEEDGYLTRAIVDAFPDRTTALDSLIAAASRRRERTKKLLREIESLVNDARPAA
jgi:predicted transcriptional regulator of viral defense system